MRKNLLTLLALIFVFWGITNAQIKKGALLLGGDIGFSTQKTSGNNSPKQVGVNFSPSVGKAIKENLFLGFSVSYNYYKAENHPVYSLQKDQGWDGSVFVRKYHQLGAGGFSLFAQGSVVYAYNKNTLSTGIDATYITNRNSIGLSAYPGLSYRVSKRLQVEAGVNQLIYLGYFHQKNEDSNIVYTESVTNGINLSSSLNNLSNLYIGFRMILDK